jgi:hypothetical protein
MIGYFSGNFQGVEMKKLIAALTLLFCSASNAAVTIVYDNTSQYSVPSITGYATNGAMMDGMTVQVNGGNTYTWADIDSDSGGVSDPLIGFNLRADGDTFNDNAWTLDFYSDLEELSSLLLDAVAGNSVFDLFHNGAVGTPGSSTGKNFATGYTGDITATYSGQVHVEGQPVSGDLYRYLLIEFERPFTGTLQFTQDTDNVSAVPIPAAAWLFGSGLAGLIGISRRKKSKAAA